MQDAQSCLTQETQILTDFYAEAGEGNDLTQQSPSSGSMWNQVYNGIARLESETTEAESEAVRTFDEFTGKAVEGEWCRGTRISRWRTARIHFTRWLGRHNSCLPVL